MPVPNLFNPLNWFGRKAPTPNPSPAAAGEGSAEAPTPGPSPAAAGEGGDGALALDADPAAVARALDALLNTDTWDETRRVLDREQELLLTVTAQLLLITNIVEARQHGDDPSAQRWAEQLELHLELLRDAKGASIAEAWPRFLETSRQRGELGGPTDGDDKDDPFLAWINTPNIMLERRFLEAHSDLVGDPASEARLEGAIANAQTMADEQFATLKPRFDAALKQPGPLPADLEQPLSEWRNLLKFTEDQRARLALLRDIRARAAQKGGDLTTAIREGYVNARGGFTLDLPPWLLEAIAQDARLREGGETDQTAPARIALWRTALTQATQERLAAEIVAEIQSNLKSALTDLRSGDTDAAQDEGIGHLESALRVYTLARLPLQYAATQNNLGIVYRARLRGEQEANQEAALACYQEALRVRTLARLPLQYAMTQNNLGIVYQERLRGEQEANQEAALACYQEALRVYTLARLPQNHRDTQLNLAFACGEWGMWELAHTAYQGALAAEELLLAQVSGGLRSSDLILRQGRGAATNDGYALTQVGRDAEAALTVERGRARGLAQARLRASGDPTRIGDPDRRRRYLAALAAFNRAQKTSNAPISGDDLVTIGGLDPATLPQDRTARDAAIEQAQRTVELARGAAANAARQRFDALVAEVRAAGDPADFLLAPLDEATLWRAAGVGEPGHALVYLIATPWGGAAIAALTANPALKTTRRYLTLGLPALTESLSNDLIQRMIPGEEHRRMVAGFAWAQQGIGFGRFLYDWPGATFREKAAALQRGCAAAGVAPEQATLDTAAQQALATLGRSPRFAPALDAPLTTLPTDDPLGLARLAAVFDAAFLRAELGYSLGVLAETALRPLAAWLNEQGATSVTLIPGGGLGTFPLLAAPVAPPAGPKETSARVFADQFPKGASVAPSARSLLRGGGDARDRDQEATKVKLGRTGVIALGDPHPSHAPLEWGEAEAITFARLARKAGLLAESHTRTMARRGWLLHALRTAWVADLSCHGVFDDGSPLDSALLLALDTTLTLRDLLSLGLAEGGADGEETQRRQTDLRGLRLLILSACQTAILDLRGAREEARSLAAGILEAGAEAALASQWSVNDKATYLLMVKFAQLWLPNRKILSPAAALAQAQCWLRNVTNADLRQWRYDTLAPISAEERKAASDEDHGADPWESEAEQAAHAAAAVAQAESVFAQPQAGQASGGVGAEALVVSRLRGLRPRRMGALADDGRDGAGDSERGERYGVKDAEEQIHVAAANADDNACPFADYFYWAGFQITGW